MPASGRYSGGANAGRSSVAEGVASFAEAQLQVSRPSDERAQLSMDRAMGYRIPSPYDSPSALKDFGVIRRHEPPPFPERRGSRNALYSPAAAAGVRTDDSGRIGAIRPNTDPYAMPWGNRDFVGYVPGGFRGPGLDPSTDLIQGEAQAIRRSGTLRIPTKFSQRVDERWPFLQLRAAGAPALAIPGFEPVYDGNARVRVTVGIADGGGGEARREFFLGGGFTGQFCLAGWDQVTVQVLELLRDSFVQFMWTIDGHRGSDQTLYRPEQIDVGTRIPVPEGAFAVVIADPAFGPGASSITIRWRTADAASPGDLIMTGNVTDGETDSSASQFGQPVPVLGTSFQVFSAPTETVNVVWFLRPI